MRAFVENVDMHFGRIPLGWFYSHWFRLLLIGVVAMATFTGLSTDAPLSYVLGQIVLGVSVYISLFILADRPLINPIQAVVGMFYWWFGVGPAVIATWNYLLLGMLDSALEAQVSGMEALWVVAPGLILYAIIARLTLQRYSRVGAYARFLLPTGNNYTPKVLIIYLLLMGLSAAIITGLISMGIQGQEETSYFGGMITTVWWVGVIAAVASIAPFVTSALMLAATEPWKTTPMVVKILIFVVVAQTVMSALFGGWKSPIAALIALYACAYICRHQRPPWLVLITGVLVFVVFIAPFVTYGRNAALVSEVSNSVQRKQVFLETLKNPREFISSGIEHLDVAVFFRGIYPLAGELTRRNGLIEGEWHGDTIAWGFEILVPRVLMPDKREANIGNFFARTVGADIGVSSRSDNLNNIAISIPFEFIGNYGLVAGVLSFGLIGFFWTLLNIWMLSPARLSNHPFTPFMVLTTMGLEAPFGHFLAALRGLVIPLLIFYFVHRMLRGKI